MNKTQGPWAGGGGQGEIAAALRRAERLLGLTGREFMLMEIIGMPASNNYTLQVLFLSEDLGGTHKVLRTQKGPAVQTQRAPSARSLSLPPCSENNGTGC